MLSSQLKSLVMFLFATTVVSQDICATTFSNTLCGTFTCSSVQNVNLDCDSSSKGYTCSCTSQDGSSGSTECTMTPLATTSGSSKVASTLAVGIVGAAAVASALA